MTSTWFEWLDRAMPQLIVAVATGLVAISVGALLMSSWNTWRKQRELDLETAKQFHTYYGDFFAT